MKLLIGGAALALVVLSVILVDYFSMTIIRAKYRTLARENTEQKEKIADYEEYIERLKTTISNFENYAKKLNIMMGFKSPDVIRGEPGLGRRRPGIGRRGRTGTRSPDDPVQRHPEPHPEGRQRGEEPRLPGRYAGEPDGQAGHDADHLAGPGLGLVSLRIQDRSVHRQEEPSIAGSTSRRTSGTPSWRPPTAP